MLYLARNSVSLTMQHIDIGIIFQKEDSHGESCQYAISQLRIVRSVLHLVTYLDVGNCCDKSTETTLHEIRGQVFLRFPIPLTQCYPYRQFTNWLGLLEPVNQRKNLLKTSCKIALVTKVAHIF